MPEQERRPPNILFITADQWRAECLSCLDHPVVRTPSLDALAADGVNFVRHYAQAAPCGPSRASMYTGMYLQNHRSGTNGTPLDARHTNIALECRKLGYDPALIGYTDTSIDPRLYAPNDPVLRTYHGVLPGFTSVLRNFEGGPVGWIEWLAERGYEIPDNPRDLFKPVADYPGAEGRGVTYPPPVFSAEESDTAFTTEAALKYLRTQRGEPWFLYLSFLRPHEPYSAAEPYNRMYDPEDVPEFLRAPTIEEEAAQHPYLAMVLERQLAAETWIGESRYPRDDRSMRQLRATYYGMMSEVDHHIGRVIDVLKETGQYDDTLIIFGSDHGDQLGDHWLLDKGPYFDQGFHVPLIIRAPGPHADGSRGRQIREFTENVDIMPTLMQLLDLEIPLQCDGASLTPFLEGEEPERWRKEAHWETDFRDVEHGQPEKRLGTRLDECCFNVIRGERYKYVHFASLPPLFFDLEKDPDELRNLAQAPEYRERVLEYAQKMISWRMTNDERTLTGMSLGPGGVVERRFAEW